MENSKLEELLRLNRPFSTAYAGELGVSRQCLHFLHGQGKIERITHGVYAPADYIPSMHYTLQLVSLISPKYVVCLVSALAFHNLTTQSPQSVFVACPAGTRIAPKDYPPIRAFAYSQITYEYGIEEHDIDGIVVKVYSVAKTVADCFRFRNKIGNDIAIEALKEGLVQKRFTIDELFDACCVCGVDKTIISYIEAITI